ncbi:hypothetical protein AN396_00290 [Candidatus Epulonipiscium fishelsonii]|uniref:Uncharacterized protein n=1 Tax=Candidatus Epulonipiscium fishelsonii TaxID=77094 RepID=A0ACC8XHI8_9FIRM|nr:hypothetical protein AN396_00290 [Epulopiscium sp. SCG-B11WGA-EpuloA1]
MKNLIDEYCLENNVDTNRIYVYGASAGGYMTTRMAVTYPDMFAAVVPICPAIDLAAKSGGVKTSKVDLQKLKDNNIWLIHSKNDPVVNFEQTTSWIKKILPKAELSAYDNVVVGGNYYSGHSAWIYVAKNMPINANGETLWEWTANQTLE